MVRVVGVRWRLGRIVAVGWRGWLVRWTDERWRWKGGLRNGWIPDRNGVRPRIDR